LNPNTNKQEMRTYLLGNLEADRRAALEESILYDRGFYEELLVVEEELIDQYLVNELSPSERKQFETHFLNTAERQKNLRFGRLLRRYLNSQPVFVPPENMPVAVRQTETPAPAKKFLSFPAGPFGRSASLGVSAAVVASIAIIVMVGWLSTRKPGQGTVKEDSSRLVTVPLMPGSQRSEGGTTQRVPVPPKGFKVRLELQVSNSNFHNYKSELFREKASLQTADELKAETNREQRQIVPWTIAGEVLSPGDYQVRLSGVLDSGHDEFIDNYSFRVTK
jgi:hypothetical protein